MVWLHYLLLALPAALVLLRADPGAAGRASWRMPLAVLALVGLAVDPATHGMGLQTLESQAVVSSLSLLVLFGLLCAELAGWALPAAGQETTIPGGGAA
jgi:hypothetical protein